MADFDINKLLDTSSQVTFTNIKAQWLFHLIIIMIKKLALRPIILR